MADWAVTSEEDEASPDAGPMESQHLINFAAFIQRGGRALYPDMPGPTSVSSRLTEEQVNQLREASRASVRTLQEELLGTTLPYPRFDKGQILNEREFLGGRLAVGMDPLRFAETRATPPPKRSRLAEDEDLWSGGLMSDMRVVSRGLTDNVRVVSRGLTDNLRVVSRGLKEDQPIKNEDILDEDRSKFPSLPKTPGTLVDSLSVLSLLNQPRPLSMADVDSLLARVGRKDPFAANAFGKAPPLVFLPATAEETRRVLNHELGVDLTLDGYDFARPLDMFERFNGQRRAPPLDAPRRKLVDAMVGWGSAVAVAQKLSKAGTISVEAPFGVIWQNRSFRDEASSAVQSVGRARAAVGRFFSPYVIDLKDPLLDYLLPDSRGFSADAHPFRKGVRDVAGFLLDFVLPGSNVKDLDGSHWVPGGAGSSATYGTINRFRKEFGAPGSGLLLMDDAQLRAVSVDPNPSPHGYSRGMFGFNPFGSELDRWSKIRGAQASMVIENPRLAPTATADNLQFWGGTFRDPYRGDSTFTIDPTFKFQKIDTDPKTGKPRFVAKHVSLQQLDHVVPLSWAWQHGIQELAEEAIRVFQDTTLATPGTIHRAPAALKQDLAIGSIIRFHTEDHFDFASMSEGNKKALAIFEAMAAMGNGADPEQFALVSAALNQAKGDKGPGRMLPYGYARDFAQHWSNMDYVRRWKRVLASSRERFEKVLGPQPNLLRPSREDALAMRQVELGVDTYGHWSRPFGEAYVRYLDSPYLLETSLYHRVRGTQLAFNVGFSMSLAAWSVVPWNRAYLTLRDHLVSGLWSNLVPKGRAFDFTLAPVADRFAGIGRFYRARYAGIPFVGESKLAGVGDDALYTLHDLLRSGRTETTTFQGVAEAISRHGEILEPGATVGSRSGRVLAASPSQLWRYFRGHPDAFGVPRQWAARPFEAGRHIDVQAEAIRRYRGFLESGEGALASAAPAGLDRGFWRTELDRFHDLTPGIDPMRSPYLHRRLYAAARDAAAADLLVQSGSQLGVKTLAASSLFEEVGSSLRARRFGEAAWYVARDLAVKAADYSLRGAFGIGGGLGNLSPVRLAAILPMESMASMASQLTGATISVPLAFSPTRFPGGVFKWLDEQQALQAASVDRARARFQQLEADLLAHDTRAARRRVARLESRASLGSPQVPQEQLSAISQEIEAFHQRTASLVAERRAARLDLARSLAYESKFRSTLELDAGWLSDARKAPGLRGKVLRAAIEHPRATAAAARFMARAPDKVATILKAPFVFTANVARAIEGNTIARRGFGALGFGLQAFGIAEGVSRYRHATRLASRPYDSLADDEKAELDSYAYRPNPWKNAFEGFLDLGGPLAIPLTPLQWAKAAPGVGLMVGNKLAHQDVLARLRQDDAYRRSEVARTMLRAPSVSEEAEYNRRERMREAQGILQSEAYLSSPFRRRVDSTSYFDQIRKVGAKEGYKPERIERELREARAKFQMVPLTDSLGYPVSVKRFGKESTAAFQLAPQYRSDRTMVLKAGGADTLRVPRPDSMSLSEQRERFAREADALRREQLLADIARRKNLFVKAGLLLASKVNPWMDRKYQGDQTDSAFVVRDAIQRRQLKPRHLESKRPR